MKDNYSVLYTLFIWIGAMGVLSTPIAKQDLVVVKPSGSIIFPLKSYQDNIDKQGSLNPNNIKMNITKQDFSGTLCQLSQTFSAYGQGNGRGRIITKENSVVTGSMNRVYYERPNPDNNPDEKYGVLQFVAIGVTGEESLPAKVTFVDENGLLQSSKFLLTDENWKITGNQEKSPQPVVHEPFNRGPGMSYYIYGSDNHLNIDKQGGSDISLWYFQAPTKFLGDHSIAYGGKFSFDTTYFSGNFNKENFNDGDSAAIVIDCDACAGPVRGGIKLYIPIKTLMEQNPNIYSTGGITSISIDLKETGGWLKDSQNVLVADRPPTTCDFIQVLYQISSIKLLGDWTKGYESVAIDNVKFNNKKVQLPLCGMKTPNAAVCDCPHQPRDYLDEHLFRR